MLSVLLLFYTLWFIDFVRTAHCVQHLHCSLYVCPLLSLGHSAHLPVWVGGWAVGGVNAYRNIFNTLNFSPAGKGNESKPTNCKVT